MASDLLKTLEDLKSRWMMGGSALEKAPTSWRAAAAGDASPDLVLLALAGQAMQFAVRATPGGELRAIAPLPRLSLPTPPPQARQQVRNLVGVVKFNDSQISAMISLLAARGYVVHPTDYMPKTFRQLPDVYAPWASWLHSDVASDEDRGYDVLNADNWDDWTPAARRAALSLLRREQPAAASELIVDRVPTLPAEERLKVLELLGEHLSPADQSLLAGFAKDRSGKVRRLVGRYLGRIGAAEDEAAEVSEFADFFSVAKKRLRGGFKITANRLKTKAQRKRRGELAEKLSLQSFAKGLQLPSELELLSGWDHVDDEASDALVRMVAATGSELAASTLASRISSLDGISGDAFQQLFDRLGKDSRRELLPRVLEHDDASYSAAAVCARGLWGEIPLAQLTSPRAFQELKKLAGEDHSRNSARAETLRQGLFSLGLLADQAAATELLQRFTATHLFASDPMLGLLKLNSCLPMGEPS